MNLNYNQLSSEKKKQQKQPTVKYVKLLSGAIGMLLEPEIRDTPE